jgi:hypothetical protein
MKHLMYAIDLDTGRVWSRLEGDRAVTNLKIAVPVLQYGQIGEGGDFTQPLTYNLETMDVSALIHARLLWTRKIPLTEKNLHRQFWGMPKLPTRPQEDIVSG